MGKQIRPFQQLLIRSQGSRISGLLQLTEHFLLADNMPGIIAGRSVELTQKSRLLNPMQEHNILPRTVSTKDCCT